MVYVLILILEVALRESDKVLEVALRATEH
jgi:hypothetical protein